MTDREGTGMNSGIRNNDDEVTRAAQKVLVLLADMDRTEAELKKRLARYGFSDEAVSAVVEDAGKKGYIDDERYACRYIEIMRKKRSLRRIEYDLEQKGVSTEIIDRCLSEAGDDEKPLIRKLLLKKLPSEEVPDFQEKNRLIASLSRKGFRVSDIVSVLDTLIENRYI